MSMNDVDHLHYAAQRLGSTLLYQVMHDTIIDRAQVIAAENPDLTDMTAVKEHLATAIAILFNRAGNGE
jgi:hypothetical protein